MVVGRGSEVKEEVTHRRKMRLMRKSSKSSEVTGARKSPIPDTAPQQHVRVTCFSCMLHSPLEHFKLFATTQYGVSSPLSSLGTDLWGSPEGAGIRIKTLISCRWGNVDPERLNNLPMVMQPLSRRTRMDSNLPNNVLQG